MVNAVSKTTNAAEASLLYGGFIFLITGLICFAIAVTPSSTISERESEIVIGENGYLVHELPDIDKGHSIGFECHFRTYLPPDSNDSFSVYVLDQESYDTLVEHLLSNQNPTIRDVILDIDMIHTAEDTDDFHFDLLFHEDEDIYIVMINNGIQKRLVITIEVDDGPPSMAYMFMAVVLVVGSILLFLSFSSITHPSLGSKLEINEQIMTILHALSDPSLDMDIRILWCQPLKDQIKWGRVDEIVTAGGIRKLVKAYNRSEGNDRLEFAAVLALIADHDYFRTVFSSGGAPALVALIENGSWKISEIAIKHLQAIDRRDLAVFLACIRAQKESKVCSLISNEPFESIAQAIDPETRLEDLLRWPLDHSMLPDWPYEENIGNKLDHITFALYSSVIVSLIRALEDPEDESEEDIFRELSNLMGNGMEIMLVITGSLPYLVRSLCDPIPEIRDRIRDILLFIADEVPQDILMDHGADRIFRDALLDQDKFTRSVAAETLGHMRDYDSLDSLFELLENEKDKNVIHAIQDSIGIMQKCILKDLAE